MIPEYLGIAPTPKVRESRGVARYQRLILCFLLLISCLKSPHLLTLPTSASSKNYQTLRLFFYCLERWVLEKKP